MLAHHGDQLLALATLSESRCQRVSQSEVHVAEAPAHQPLHCLHRHRGPLGPKVVGLGGTHLVHYKHSTLSNKQYCYKSSSTQVYMSTSTSVATSTKSTSSSSSSSPSSHYLTPMPILVHVVCVVLLLFLLLLQPAWQPPPFCSILQASKAAVRTIIYTRHGHKQQQYDFVQGFLLLTLLLLLLLIATASSIRYSHRVASTGSGSRCRPTASFIP